MAVQRPSSVGMLPAQQEGLFSVRGTLGQAGHREHKTHVPVNRLHVRLSSPIALQRPSSVGIRPVKYLIERFVSRMFTRIPVAQFEHKSAYQSTRSDAAGGPS